MTCQHCQTWILDGDHRCSRCGRRVRPAGARISPATYPIAAAATAPAYDFAVDEAPVPTLAEGQGVLFSAAAAPVVEGRVIPFDTLTSPAERDAIRSRWAETQRPAPVRNDRVDSRRARSKRAQTDQQSLEFSIDEHLAPAPGAATLCEAPVATASLRVEAALFDALLIACGFGPGLALFFYMGGRFTADKHVLPFLAATLFTVPLLYKLLWAFAGKDTPGTRIAGLELVDFDGRKPSKRRRYTRLVGSALSLLAAGLGMIWSLVDEDKLTWHDHMSGTFPTFLA